MHDPLDTNCIPADAEENYVVTHSCQSRFHANFGPQTMDLRISGNFLHPRAKQSKHSRRVARTVLRDVFRDFFQVTRH
jgi:hypothetical protein